MTVDVFVFAELKTSLLNSHWQANARDMLPDVAQIFVQVLRGQEAARGHVVECGGELSPEHGVNDGELLRDDRQILGGVAGVEQECAAGQLQTAQLVGDAVEMGHFHLILEDEQRLHIVRCCSDDLGEEGVVSSQLIKFLGPFLWYTYCRSCTALRMRAPLNVG